MRRPQDLVEEAADGALAEDLVALEIARGDDEVLQGVALQVVHHHVHGLVLAEEVQHRDHARMADLREAAPFLEEALQAQAVQRLLLGLDTRRQLAWRSFGERGWQVFLDRHVVAVSILGQIDHAKTAGGQPAYHTVTTYGGIGRQRCRFDF